MLRSFSSHSCAAVMNVSRSRRSVDSFLCRSTQSALVSPYQRSVGPVGQVLRDIVLDELDAQRRAVTSAHVLAWMARASPTVMLRALAFRFSSFGLTPLSIRTANSRARSLAWKTVQVPTRPIVTFVDYPSCRAAG